MFNIDPVTGLPSFLVDPMNTNLLTLIIIYVAGLVTYRLYNNRIRPDAAAAKDAAAGNFPAWFVTLFFIVVALAALYVFIGSFGPIATVVATQLNFYLYYVLFVCAAVFIVVVIVLRKRLPETTRMGRIVRLDIRRVLAQQAAAHNAGVDEPVVGKTDSTDTVVVKHD